MRKRRIVVITDCYDVAYSEVRGVILKHLEEVSSDDIEIEPVVKVSPFSVINASFILDLMVAAYPPGTIFLVIVNPLKIRPERLIVQLKNTESVIVTANTGSLHFVANRYGILESYEIHDNGFVPFGGKFVHAPTAANIAMGVLLEKLGSVFNGDIKMLVEETKDVVLHIDNFGLMKITNKIGNPTVGCMYEVSVGSCKFTAKYDSRMMNNNDNEWVIYPGSSFDLLEIGRVRANGAEYIGAKVGDKVSIVKLE